MPTLTGDEIIANPANCPMCGNWWAEHVRKGDTIRCPDGTTLDVRPALEPIHTREQPAFALTDIAFGTTCLIVGAVITGIGAFRPQACIPIYVYGAALAFIGGMLVKAGWARR